jgi:hypothetical protein
MPPSKVQETVECVTRSLTLLSQSASTSEDVLHAGVDTLSKLIHESVLVAGRLSWLLFA